MKLYFYYKVNFLKVQVSSLSMFYVHGRADHVAANDVQTGVMYCRYKFVVAPPRDWVLHEITQPWEKNKPVSSVRAHAFGFEQGTWKKG